MIKVEGVSAGAAGAIMNTAGNLGGILSTFAIPIQPWPSAGALHLDLFSSSISFLSPWLEEDQAIRIGTTITIRTATELKSRPQE